MSKKLEWYTDTDTDTDTDTLRILIPIRFDHQSNDNSSGYFFLSYEVVLLG